MERAWDTVKIGERVLLHNYHNGATVGINVSKYERRRETEMLYDSGFNAYPRNKGWEIVSEPAEHSADTAPPELQWSCMATGDRVLLRGRSAPMRAVGVVSLVADNGDVRLEGSDHWFTLDTWRLAKCNRLVAMRKGKRKRAVVSLATYRKLSDHADALSNRIAEQTQRLLELEARRDGWVQQIEDLANENTMLRNVLQKKTDREERVVRAVKDETTRIKESLERIAKASVA